MAGQPVIKQVMRIQKGMKIRRGRGAAAAGLTDGHTGKVGCLFLKSPAKE